MKIVMVVVLSVESVIDGVGVVCLPVSEWLMNSTVVTNNMLLLKQRRTALSSSCGLISLLEFDDTLCNLVDYYFGTICG
jgi:hypothetical protein